MWIHRWGQVNFTLSNCLHSQLRQICVLPQHESTSLERHLHSGWLHLWAEMGGGLTVMPPAQLDERNGYSGTADAVYQNISLLTQKASKAALVLASDHLYKMDYRPLLSFHTANAADLTIVCTEVALDQARRFGVIEAGPGHRVVGFHEKPAVLQRLKHREDRALVSMGIYVFDPRVLKRVLDEDSLAPDSQHDFGRDIIPRLLAQSDNVYAYDAAEQQLPEEFYWRDIGVIDTYWEASMELLEENSAFDLYDLNWPVYGYQPISPPARVFEQESPGSGLDRSLLCPGVTVSGARVDRSILSPGVTIERGAEVVESVILGDVHVGEGARIHKAIVGEGVRVPPGYSIGINPENDGRRFHVSPGGVVVVADITSAKHLERNVDHYALEMAPMGWSPADG
jgi:glucose-1-phosphate adenylyltransferase